MLSTLEQVAVTEPAPVGLRPLVRYHDRCDRCGSEAFILAIKDGTELTFCGHHGRENKVELLIQGFVISDETHRLIPTPPVFEDEDE